MEEKVVTMKDIVEKVKLGDTKYTDIEWNGINLHIKYALSIEEMVEFVNGVVSACFDDNLVGYHPEFKDIAMDTYIMYMYGGINVFVRHGRDAASEGDEEESNMELCYKIAKQTDLMSVIISNIDNCQLHCMENAIKERIQYIIHSNAYEVSKKVDEIYALIDKLDSDIGGIVDGVDQGVIKDAFGAISSMYGEGGIDKDKMIELYKTVSSSQPGKKAVAKQGRAAQKKESTNK